MKRFAHLSIAALLCTTVLLAVAAQAHDDEDSSKTVTLTGEILDLQCYMLHPDHGHGPDHAKCANSCIDRGLPAAFLSGGEMYMLLGPGHESAAKIVSGHAGHPVKLTGKLVEVSGAKAIQVESVHDAGGAGSRPSHGG